MLELKSHTILRPLILNPTSVTGVSRRSNVCPMTNLHGYFYKLRYNSGQRYWTDSAINALTTRCIYLSVADTWIIVPKSTSSTSSWYPRTRITRARYHRLSVYLANSIIPTSQPVSQLTHALHLHTEININPLTPTVAIWVHL